MEVPWKIFSNCCLYGPSPTRASRVFGNASSTGLILSICFLVGYIFSRDLGVLAQIGQEIKVSLSLTISFLTEDRPGQ